MRSRSLVFLGLLGTTTVVLALDGCTNSDDSPTPTVTLPDASLPVPAGDASASDDASTQETGAPTDAGPDSEMDSGTDAPAPMGMTPCPVEIDAGDGGAGCAWMAVDTCEADASIFDFCGSDRTPGRGYTCSNTVADLALASGPDGGPYYDFKVNRCLGTCAVNPNYVVWQCMECCAN